MNKHIKQALVLLPLVLSVFLTANACARSDANFKQNIIAQMNFNRSVVKRLLDEIDKTGKADAYLARRVAPKRAPLGWHLMHLAATEDRFAGLLVGTGPKISAEWTKKFRSGKSAASDVPPIKEIRKYLNDSRAALLKSIDAFDMARINEKPEGERFDFKTAFPILLYHEPHHHGQAKATFNILSNK